MLDHETIKIKRRLPVQVLFSAYYSNSRGVISMIHKSIPLRIDKVTKDPTKDFWLYREIFYQLWLIWLMCMGT